VQRDALTCRLGVVKPSRIVAINVGRQGPRLSVGHDSSSVHRV
jgi:hypothetical protein